MLKYGSKQKVKADFIILSFCIVALNAFKYFSDGADGCFLLHGAVMGEFCQRARQQPGPELGSRKCPACLESAAGAQGDNVPDFRKINKEWEIKGFLLLFGITNDHSVSLEIKMQKSAQGSLFHSDAILKVSRLIKSWYCYSRAVNSMQYELWHFRANWHHEILISGEGVCPSQNLNSWQNVSKHRRLKWEVVESKLPCAF